MRIRGYIFRHGGGHCFFRAFFACGQLEKPAPILLMVDTGATTTTILDGDCERLGLDCSELPRSDQPTRIVGAEIYPHVLSDVAFIFIDTVRRFFDFRSRIVEVVRLPRVEVIEQTEESPRPPFSLMGMDIVTRYGKLTYEYGKGIVTLER